MPEEIDEEEWNERIASKLPLKEPLMKKKAVKNGLDLLEENPDLVNEEKINQLTDLTKGFTEFTKKGKGKSQELKQRIIDQAPEDLEEKIRERLDMKAIRSFERGMRIAGKLYDEGKPVQEIREKLDELDATDRKRIKIINELYYKKARSKGIEAEASVKCSNCGEENTVLVKDESMFEFPEFKCHKCGEKNRVDMKRVKEILLNKGQEEKKKARE